MQRFPVEHAFQTVRRIKTLHESLDWADRHNQVLSKPLDWTDHRSQWLSKPLDWTSTATMIVKCPPSLQHHTAGPIIIAGPMIIAGPIIVTWPVVVAGRPANTLVVWHYYLKESDVHRTNLEANQFLCQNIMNPY